VLVKGGVHLENLGRLRAIAFDKTGTITHGAPTVTEVVPLDTLDGDQLLALAAALESRSAHPLAEAVVAEAQAKGLALPEVDEVESLTGRGLKTTLAGEAVLIGTLKLMEEAAVAVTPEARARVVALQAAGQTIMAVARGRKLLGVIAAADTVRPTAASTLQVLRRLGVQETVMLTGDNARVAGAIAGQVGLTAVRADLMPEDKVTTIRALNARYGHTAMVGDGVNDAPALAHATVGIAMGGAATDVALETSDVALMGDDLGKLPFAVGLGRATRAIILQNLYLSLGVIALLGVASLTGWAGIGAAIVLHEGSTILVALNALRLLAYRLT
jgi:Cd2+/Zn2+-exporting ATPase